MARRASMDLLARGVARAVPRASASASAAATLSASTLASTPVASAGSMRRSVHSIVSRRGLELPTEATARTIVGAVAAGLVVAAAALTILHEDATAYCEALSEADDSASATPRSTYFDEDYEPCHLVGSGSFGMVMQCVSKHDGHVAAVKMIQDVNDMQDEVARETEALALVQCAGGHANIVRYDGRYAHDGFHYIVTEFVDGESLYALIQKRRQLEVATALELTAQLASALAFLRAQHLIHRDLKPANIMVQRHSPSKGAKPTLQAKIIDFGSAEHYADASPATLKQARAMALSGTRCYWPPEVLEKQETSPAMDMWALGCILYIMIAGRHPFDMMGSSSEDEIVHRVTTENVSFLHPEWKTVSSSVKSLIRGLLEKDPRHD